MTQPQRQRPEQPPVVGYTPAQLEAAASPLEAAVVAALFSVAAAAAAKLVTVPAGAPKNAVGAAYVTLDDLAAITTMWLRHTDRELMPILRGVFHDTAEHVHGQISKMLADLAELPPGVTEIPSEVAPIPDVHAEDLLSQARNRLVGIGDLLWANAREQMAQGMREGESIPQLADRVRSAAGVSEPRATVITRTEVVSVSNGASIAQARTAGVPLEKEWMATEDMRTRLTHREADGQRVPLGEPFIVGGFPLDFPGDPVGPPGEIINCRCSLGFHLASEIVTAAARKLEGETLAEFNRKHPRGFGGKFGSEIWKFFDGWSNGYLTAQPEPTTAAAGPDLTGAELAEFNRLHPRDRKGKFADHIGDAIASGVPARLDEFTREQLRRYATDKRGLVLPRGASVEVIKERLLKSAGRQVGGAVAAEQGPLPDRAVLGRMRVPELRELAKTRGVKVSAKAKKADIVDALAEPAGPSTQERPTPGIPTYVPPASLSTADQARAVKLIRRDPQIFATTQDRFGGISTSGNLTGDDAAWLQSVFEREPAFVNRLAQDAQIKRRLDEQAKKAGKTPSAYRSAVASDLKAAFADKPIVVRVTDEAAVRGILQQGRFRTQFDAGTRRAPGLTVDLTKRRLGEQILGVDPDTPPERRPVYGYVAVNGVEPALSAGTKIPGIAQREGQEDVLSSYGRVQVVLKPGVRQRTTATVGDSLDEIGFMRPSPVDNPTAESVGFRNLADISKPGWTRSAYVEAQVHGGVAAGDIAEVVFPAAPDAETKKSLSDAGIPWRVLTDQPVPDGVAAARARQTPQEHRAMGTPAQPKPSAIISAPRTIGPVPAAPRFEQVDVSGYEKSRTKAKKNLAALDMAPVRVLYEDPKYNTKVTGLEAPAPLPKSVQRAVTRYMGSPASINNLMRLDRERLARYSKDPEELARSMRTGTQYVRELDKAMAASPLSDDVVTYRGIPAERASVFTKLFNEAGGTAPQDFTGLTWTDGGFVSTSTSKTYVEDHFSDAALTARERPVLMRIVVPKGTHGLRISDDKVGLRESELLLDRGLTFRVVADHGVGDRGYGRHVLDVEIVPKATPVVAAGGLSGDALDEFNRLHPRGFGGRFGHKTGVPGTGRAAVLAGDFRGLTRVGGQLGFNRAALFEDESGQKWYVKAQPSVDHANNEALAAALYRKASVTVPEVHTGSGAPNMGDGPQTASEWMDLDTADKSDRIFRRDVHMDFGVHAWLANWDAAGAGGRDNLEVEAGTPFPVLVDAGGALLFRGAGGSKDDMFGDEVFEFDTLRDPRYNPTASQLFGDMTPEELAQAAERVEKITPRQIRDLVAEYDMPPSLAERLIARQKDLVRRGEQIRLDLDVQADPDRKSGRAALAAAGARLSDRPAGQTYDTSAELTFAEDPGWSDSKRRKVADILRWYRTRTYRQMGEYQRGQSDVDEVVLQDSDEEGNPVGLLRTEKIGEHIAYMHDAFAKSPLQAPVLLYRGVQDGERVWGDAWRPDGDMVGMEWTELSPTSTSASESVGKMFESDALMRLHVPAGLGGIQLNGWPTQEAHTREAELLLQPGLRYRIVGDHSREEQGFGLTFKKRVFDVVVEAIPDDEQ